MGPVVTRTGPRCYDRFHGHAQARYSKQRVTVGRGGKKRSGGSRRAAAAPRERRGTEHGKGELKSLSDARLFLLIVGVAFVLRMIYIMQLQSSPWFDAYEMDPQFNHQWATAIANGESFMDGPYFRAPLYTWFLGIIYRLFGTGPWAPRIVQAVIGALNCGLLFIVGRRAFNRAVGIIAGIAGAFYWTFAYFDGTLLSPVLIIFFNLLLIWGLLSAGARRRPLLWLANGVLLGLSAITRPDILLLAPAAAVWIVTLHRPVWKRAAGYAALLFCGCLLVILPITIRNYIVSGEPVLIATNGGVNFYIGNNPRSDGISAGIPGDPIELVAGHEAQVARAEEAVGRPLSAREVSSYYTRETLRYIAAQPGEALGRMAKKLVYFWTRYEIPNNQDIYFIVENYTPVTRFMPLGFWLVGPLGLLGLLLSLRRARELFPLWCTVCVYLAVSAAFFVNARFRVAAAAVLVVLAAYAAHWLYHTVRRRAAAPLVFAVVVLLCGILLVTTIPPGGDMLHAQAHAYAGFALAKQGKYAEAERMITKSIELSNRSGRTVRPKTIHALGLVRRQLNDYAGAQTCYEQLLAMNPEDREARLALASVLERRGKIEAAIETFLPFLEQEPDNADVHLTVGKLLVRDGRMERGLRHLSKSAELEPDNVQALIDEAFHLVQQKRYDDSIALLRIGLVHKPDEPLILVPLVRLLAHSEAPGARREAVALGETAVERTAGGNPRVLFALAVAYESAGRPAEAVALARRALPLAEEQGIRNLAVEVNAFLERFAEEGTP